jgi:hypothetical protein
MDTKTTPFHIVTQGSVKLSHDYGYLLLGNDECVTFYIDLDTRWAEVLATGNGGMGPDDLPLIMLGANENTTDLHPDHARDDATWIEFPHFPGWNIHAVSLSKNVMAVALTNPAKEPPYDTYDTNLDIRKRLLLRSPVRFVYFRSGGR